jgi:hypothetical protein
MNLRKRGNKLFGAANEHSNNYIKSNFNLKRNLPKSKCFKMQNKWIIATWNVQETGIKEGMECNINCNGANYFVKLLPKNGGSGLGFVCENNLSKNILTIENYKNDRIFSVLIIIKNNNNNNNKK